MNPTSRWRAALNLSLLTDATRSSLLTGIEKVAPQSPLIKLPAVAAGYADLTAGGTAFSTAVAAAAADEKQAKVSAAARDVARASYDLALATLRTLVENNAKSTADITSMGFSALTVTRAAKTPPDAPASVLVCPSKVHGKARVVVAGVGNLGSFVAEVATDPITVWTSLPGTGKERKLSGYACGTKLWVHFAQVRWGLQGPWSTPVMVIIP
jgi:hypothetical protein